MKIIKGILLIFGFFLPLLIGSSFAIPDNIELVWICVFSFGIISKLLLQTFEKPFMNVSPNRQAPDHQERILNSIGIFIFFLAVGSLLGELFFYKKLGAIPITLLIFGASIYIGAHYINIKNWFFNQ